MVVVHSAPSLQRVDRLQVLVHVVVAIQPLKVSLCVCACVCEFCDVILAVGDSDYVSLGRIPPDQQRRLEMEEGNDLYTIPDTNPMYMAIDRHTMQGKTERRREKRGGESEGERLDEERRYVEGK